VEKIQKSEKKSEKKSKKYIGSAEQQNSRTDAEKKNGLPDSR